MEKIPLTFGLPIFADHLEHSDAALSADPDTQDLAKPFQDMLEAWEDRYKEQRAARRAVIRAQAVVGVTSKRLDDTTGRLAALTRGVAPALLGRLFSMAPSVFLRRPLRDRCDQTRNVILVELAKLDGAHPLKPFATQLEGLVNTVLGAVDGRAKAKGERKIRSNDIKAWKESVNDLRTTTYAELLKIAVAKGYPRDWVESFFRPLSSDDVEAEEPEAPEPAPAEASG
jgi:hypothetical protein